MEPGTSQYRKSGEDKKYGQDDLKKQQEKGGMFTSNVDRIAYIGTLPSRKRQKTDRVDISFYRYSTDVHKLDFEKIPGGESMDVAAMKDKIVEIIANQLGIDHGDVTPEASVVDDLGADSLDVVELVMALEEEFNLEIPDEEAEKIKSVRDIFSHMENALQLA